jgi:hypothetical protein
MYLILIVVVIVVLILSFCMYVGYLRGEGVDDKTIALGFLFDIPGWVLVKIKSGDDAYKGSYHYKKKPLDKRKVDFDSYPSQNGMFHTSVVPVKSSEEQLQEKQLLEAGGWQCSCGKVHPAYVSSCACGKNKHVRTPEPEPKAIPVEKPLDTEADNVNAIREYKKLMDDGIISQEEFEAKKKQLLSL